MVKGEERTEESWDGTASVGGLETPMGGYLFSRCAEDEERARQCFRFLDEGGLGRDVSEGSVA